MAKTSVFVKLKAHEGKGDGVLDALREALPAAEGEQGTELYTFHRDNADPDTIWVFEVYADEGAFAAHSQSDAVAALFAEMAGLLAGPPELSVATYVAGKGVAT